MVTKANSRGQSRMVIERLERLPLLAQIDADVRAGHSQIRAALVEAQVLHLVAFVQLDRLEILQLAQIPQLDARIFGGRGQVVAVLRERERSNRTGMA